MFCFCDAPCAGMTQQQIIFIPYCTFSVLIIGHWITFPAHYFPPCSLVPSWSRVHQVFYVHSWVSLVCNWFRVHQYSMFILGSLCPLLQRLWYVFPPIKIWRCVYGFMMYIYNTQKNLLYKELGCCCLLNLVGQFSGFSTCGATSKN